MAKKPKKTEAERAAYKEGLLDAAALADQLRTAGNVIGDLPAAIRALADDSK